MASMFISPERNFKSLSLTRALLLPHPPPPPPPAGGGARVLTAPRPGLRGRPPTRQGVTPLRPSGRAPAPPPPVPGPRFEAGWRPAALGESGGVDRREDVGGGPSPPDPAPRRLEPGVWGRRAAGRRAGAGGAPGRPLGAPWAASDREPQHFWSSFLGGASLASEMNGEDRDALGGADKEALECGSGSACRPGALGAEVKLPSVPE
ncbi:ephrin-A1 isoform X3 [Suricata suricatta]|uniref:ephrin-A1 isoform X3 n=1 Tax=Suricata suricatta TaxID=37032 RepID=UPI0011560570|nr:ephrin-A1 isoform X3 [Suricata suricatta]